MQQKTKKQAKFAIYQEKYQEAEKQLILKISDEQALYAKRFKKGEISWYQLTEHIFGCLTQLWSVYLTHQIDSIDGFDLEAAPKQALWEETVLETLRSARISLKNKNLDGLLFLFMWKEKMENMLKSFFENSNQRHALWANLDQRIKAMETLVQANKKLLSTIKSQQDMLCKSQVDIKPQRQTKQTSQHK